MIHPDAELRYISPTIGYGLFASRLIPKGTIMFALDPLDQSFTRAQLAALPEMLRKQVMHFHYIGPDDNVILCWDHARFLNHSCAANMYGAGYDFEIALRDIEPGEEILDDYGTLGYEVPKCLCGAPNCRGRVRKDDPLREAAEWDKLLASAFPAIPHVAQPLWELVREKEEIAKILAGELAIPSTLAFYRGAAMAQSA